jgi:glycosyltransferase involved in cell wall biosynthesis
MLAEELMRLGHSVLWWTSTLDHFTKRNLYSSDREIQGTNGVRLQFLHGVRYFKNVSIARYLNHVQIGRAFAKLSIQQSRPDVIVCSLPTVELAFESVRYGTQMSVPVIIDARDLWPDIFLDVLPAALRTVGRIILAPLFAKAAFAIRSADRLVAVSEGYLDWAVARAERPRRQSDRVFPLAFARPSISAEEKSRSLNRLKELGIRFDKPIIAFAGTFGRSYDLDTAIRAASIVSEDPANNLTWVLCGDGERADEWRSRAAHLDSVVMPGWLSAVELASLLEVSTLGLAAYAQSAPQGIPNKVVEYLAFGLPILSTLSGETNRLICRHSCGSSYRAGDARDLAAKVVLYLRDAARCLQERENARRVFEDEFNASKVFGEMAQFVVDAARSNNQALQRGA